MTLLIDGQVMTPEELRRRELRRAQAARWRARHRAEYNAYMRAYRARRKAAA